MNRHGMRFWSLFVVLMGCAGSVLAQSAISSRASASKSLPKAMAAPAAANDTVALSAAVLKIAEQVFVGTMMCDAGDRVQVKAHAQTGYFELEYKKMRYKMLPVESRTGAVRLEDPAHGVMWLQLGDKSMLMSQSRGMRLADDCAGHEQVLYAQQMKLKPMRGLLEAPDPSLAAMSGASQIVVPMAGGQLAK